MRHGMSSFEITRFASESDSPRSTMQQRDMVQNVSAWDASIFIDYQVLAFEKTPPEDHVYVHSRSEARGSIETGHFLAWAGSQTDSKLFDSLARQQRDVSAAIHEQGYI